MTRPMKIFLSQPMNGLDRAQLIEKRNEILEDLPDILNVDEIEEIPSLFDEKTVTRMHPLYCLGMSLQLLSAADLAVFAPGWESSRGCRIEHECAVQYGIRMLDLSDGQLERNLE